MIAQGDDFGTLEEHYFFIDPSDYYVIDSGSGSSPSSTSDGSSSNMMPNNGEGSGNMTPNSGMVAFTEEADLISIPANNFFCGVNFTDAADRCHLTCPSGTSAECPVGEACFRNTPCSLSGSIMSENSGGGAAEATGAEGPTTSPAPSISYNPTTSLEPTSTARPTIMPLPLVAQEILDQSAWFCGKGESSLGRSMCEVFCASVCTMIL